MCLYFFNVTIADEKILNSMAEEGDIDDIEMAEPEEEDDGWEYYDDNDVLPDFWQYFVSNDLDTRNPLKNWMYHFSKPYGKN